MASIIVKPSATASEPLWRRQGYPSMSSDDERVRGWFNQHVNVLSPRRRFQCQRAALNLWMYLDRQWIEPCLELAPGNGSYHFREVYRRSNAAFPRPVTNIIAPAVDNEAGRLARKEYVPDTSAGKNEPDWVAAARLAKDIIKWEMSKQMWEAKREEIPLLLCLDGVVGLRTWWDENDIEQSLVAAPDPKTCQTCGARFASAEVPRAMVVAGVPTPLGPAPFRHTETLSEVAQQGEPTAVHPGGIEMVRMQTCPICEQASPLVSYNLSEEEALTTDQFGRPLGMLVPRGEGLIDVVSIHEYFPQNGGVGLAPHEECVHAQMSVRSLEWLALRYPEVADTLAPEDATQLLRVHPLYSEPALLGLSGRGQAALPGVEIYPNHAFLKELVVDPQPHIPGLELGAYFAQIGQKIVRRDLCVEVEGPSGVRRVPRLKYHWARFKRLPKMFYVRTFVDSLIPLQRRLNEIDAQWIDLRERGKPNVWVPKGTELALREDSQGGSLEVIEYDAALAGWDPKSSIFPGVPLTGTTYSTERQQVMTDAQLIGAAQDIEMGQAPGSVKTTSGLMLLSEEASQKRGPRERSLVQLYESAFEHILELNYAFRKEDATYEIRTEGGIYEQKSYTGSDLVGSIRVKMAARAGYDETLYNKEATAEAINMGLYRMDTPAAIDRALENMKLPKDVNQKQTLQIQRAEMAWSDFIRGQKVPVIDPTIFDASAWYSILSQRWMTDECYALQQKAHWDAVLPALANWEQRKAEMEALDAQQKAAYGNVPQDQWQAKYKQGQELRQQAVDAMKQVQESQQKLSTEAGADTAAALAPQAPMPEPPQVPPPPLEGFLPEQLELRIYTVWMRMLPQLAAGLVAVKAGQALKAPLDETQEAVLALNDLLRMRAVVEAFRLMMIPAPMMAPPPGAAGPPAGPPGAPPGPAAAAAPGPAPAG